MRLQARADSHRADSHRSGSHRAGSGPRSSDLSPGVGRGGRLLATSEGRVSDAFGPRDWALLVCVAMIWGSSFLWIDMGLESLRPGVIAMVRVLLGMAVLAVVRAARAPIERADRGRVALLGLAWVGVPLALFPVAQQWVDSSVAGMMNGATPLATAVWATLLLGRPPGRPQRIGLVLGFAGVAAISWPQLASSHAAATGVGLLLLSVSLYGLAANLAVPLQQKYGALPVLLWAQLAGLVIVVPFGVAQLPGSEFSATALLAMIPLGVLSTGLAFVMMISLAGRVGSTRGSLPIFFSAPVALVLGVAVRGDALAASAWGGGVLVVVGAWLASRRDTGARNPGTR